MIDPISPLTGRELMPTFILMTRLAAASLHDAPGRRALGKTWLEKVRHSCPQVTWLAHYALLGPYDFMDIYEAPDLETAHRVSLISRSVGALTAESWQAMPYEDHLRIFEELQD
jgi:uncharacterized protein with GYD domain